MEKGIGCWKDFGAIQKSFGIKLGIADKFLIRRQLREIPYRSFVQFDKGVRRVLINFGYVKENRGFLEGEEYYREEEERFLQEWREGRA